MKRQRVLSLLSYVLFLGAIYFLFGGGLGWGNDNLAYSEVLGLFEKEQVKSFVVRDDQIRLELHEPLEGESVLVCDLADADEFRADLRDLLKEQAESGVLESYDFIDRKSTRLNSSHVC